MTFCVADDTCNTDLAGGFGKITCPSKPAATGDAAAATGDGSIYLRIASASLILLGTLTQIWTKLNLLQEKSWTLFINM